MLKHISLLLCLILVTIDATPLVLAQGLGYNNSDVTKTRATPRTNAATPSRSLSPKPISAQPQAAAAPNTASRWGGWRTSSPARGTTAVQRTISNQGTRVATGKSISTRRTYLQSQQRQQKQKGRVVQTLQYPMLR